MCRPNSRDKRYNSFNRFFFSDIETTEFKSNSKIDYDLEFKMSCIIHYDFELEKELERKSFFNNSEYVKYLISLGNCRYFPIIYFHNLSFDSKFLIEYFLESEQIDNIKFIRTGSKILSVSIYQNYKKILELRDSYCLLITKIETLGKMVDLEKLEFNFDYSNKQKAIEYCFRDCQIIYKSIEYLIMSLNQFFKDKLKKPYKIKDIPLTIASLSKKIMKLYFNDVYYQNDFYLDNHLRKYYFGGRTEVFDFNLLENGYYYDVNSMYPSVLSKNIFALGKTYRYESNQPIDFSVDSIIAYEVEIKENQHYPLYPERDLETNKISFKNGVKRVIMTKSEFFYLQENEYFTSKKIEILKTIAVFFAFNQTNFSELFENLYYERKHHSKKTFFNYFLKIFMNSVYGKFGQRKEREKLVIINHLNEIDKIENTEILEKNEIFYKREKKISYFQQINLMNAVLTTSYARFELWKKLIECQEKNINVYYCDTDSLVVDSIVQLEISDKLGKWSIEMNLKQFQAIDSKEYYYINDNNEFKAKFKGIRNEKLDTREAFKRHYLEGTIQDLIATPLYCLNRKSDFKKVYAIKKEKKTYYYKRKINLDLTTNPINLNDDLEVIEFNNLSYIANLF